MERQKTTPDFLWSRQASSHRLPLGFSFMYVNLGPQVLNTAGAEVASVDKIKRFFSHHSDSTLYQPEDDDGSLDVT